MVNRLISGKSASDYLFFVYVSIRMLVQQNKISDGISGRNTYQSQQAAFFVLLIHVTHVDEFIL